MPATALLAKEAAPAAAAAAGTLTDCASGQQNTARYPHGVGYSEQQAWKSGKIQQDVTVNREPSSPTFMKGYTDSGNLYDSSRTDSGFLSGANIVSDQCISDEVSTEKSQDSSQQGPSTESKVVSKDDMRLDSGVDVGLSENFHSLSLKNNSLNDLNDTSTKFRSQDSTLLANINVTPSPKYTCPLAPVEKTQTSGQPDPTPIWELYFQQDDDGDTQLHIAIIQGFIEVVYSLILMAPHPCFLDIQNELYQTPLHLAVLTCQPRIVRRLLVAGATVDMRDRNGNTALHRACQLGDVECVKALMEPISVAEANIVHLQYTAYQHQVPQNLEERNYDGQTCVHLAAVSGHVDVLRHLLWFGANVNARDAKSGRTVLHYAVEMGLGRVMRFLLEECRLQLEVEAANYAGHTAHQLASCADAALARQLAKHGALPKTLPEDSDEEDTSDDEDEMYQKPSGDNFSSLRINGQPINISA